MHGNRNVHPRRAVHNEDADAASDVGRQAVDPRAIDTQLRRQGGERGSARRDKGETRAQMLDGCRDTVRLRRLPHSMLRRLGPGCCHVPMS